MVQALRRLLLVIVLAGTVAAPVARAADDTLGNPLIFDEIWRTVRDRFYDPGMHGRDWVAIAERYRPAYSAAGSAVARTAVVNRMLNELGASHLGYFTPDDPAYYQLADIFFGRQPRREALRRAFPGGEISYPGIGIFTTTEPDGRMFVGGVIDGGAAWQAGLLTGDEILAVDGKPFQPVASFRDKAGQSVDITVRRVAGAAPIDIRIVPETIKPATLFLRGLEASVRLIPANGLKIGYVHVWSYASGAYQEALERLVSDGPLKDADALIWDLRDGWGGAQVEYLDLFNRNAPTLEAAGRNGTYVTRTARWRKPVAMLINGGTRSGKEILAYGFKKYGLGEVIGTTTAKDVLAATAFFMSDNSLLEVAVNDVKVDGERLENVGVTPTIEVPFERAYANGHDPQLDKAVEVLSRPRMN